MLSAFSNRARKTFGFTLVETLVAISIFLILITTSAGIFTNAFATQRKAGVAKVVAEESRIALERIVKEVRRGTIDYEEYWNRFDFQSGSVDYADYGEYYGEYAKQFYRNPGGSVPTLVEPVTRFDENIGSDSGVDPLRNANLLDVCSAVALIVGDPPPIPTAPGSSGYDQCELYLISADGTEKTILKLIPEDVGAGAIEYHLEMLKLQGSDADSDGMVETWTAAADFCADPACATRQFQKIQPDSIQITALKFYVAPLEDPRKAFAEFTTDVQQQPHVTIKMTAEPSALRARGVRGDVPSITLQTTIGARAQNEVKSLP